MIDVIGILPGLLVGVVIWTAFVRPLQLREHERRRRAAGLPAARKLPEDDG